MSNNIQLKRPWSTVVTTIIMGLLFSLVVMIFTDNQTYIMAVSFFLGLSLAVYNDYITVAWRSHTRSRILGVVSADSNTTEATAANPIDKSEDSALPTNQDLFIPDDSDGVFSSLKPLALSSLSQLHTIKNHRFDRLRQYRTNMRYFVSIMMIVLMIGYIAFQYFNIDNYQPPYMVIFITLCILLEYNISLLKGKHVPGVFFRDHSSSEEDTENVTASMEGDVKISWLMKRNPLALGMGLFGRPFLGVIFCWLLLLAISSWVVWIACIVLSIFIVKYLRRKLELPDGPFTLLRLRVFDTPSYDKYLELLECWQYIGVQYRLDGPDTSGYSLNSRLKVLLGKEDEIVIKNDTELDAALMNMSKTHDKFERYHTKSIQCDDATWIKGLNKFIEQSDLVVMLLTDFSKENNGCVVELKILMDSIPMSKITLLVNSATDFKYLRNVLNHAWKNRSDNSPNDEVVEGPYVLDIDDLYEYKTQNHRSGVKVKMQLIDFLYSKVK